MQFKVAESEFSYHISYHSSIIMVLVVPVNLSRQIMKDDEKSSCRVDNQFMVVHLTLLRFEFLRDDMERI